MNQDSLTAKSSDKIQITANPVSGSPAAESSEWTVTVTHGYDGLLTFSFRLVGLSGEWLIMMEPLELKIAKGERGQAKLKLRPITNPAEEQPFALVAWCQEDPTQYAREPLKTAALAPSSTPPDDHVTVGQIKVSLQSTKVTVQPGKTQVVSVTCENQGLQDVSVTLQVKGLPEKWGAMSKDVQLHANESSKTVSLPPLIAPLKADLGIYPLMLQIQSGGQSKWLPLFLEVKEAFSTTIVPKTLTLKPGESTMTLSIHNQSKDDHSFSLGVSSIDNIVTNWFKFSHDRLTVLENSSDEISITVTQPDNPTPLAGVYFVEILTEDIDNSRSNSSVIVQLLVNRVGDYSVGPGEVISNNKQSAVYKLPVTNNANASLNVRLKDAPPKEPFKFSTPPPEITVEPDTSEFITVTVTLKEGESLPAGSTIGLVTEGEYQLVGGSTGPASEHTWQVTWPRPPGPAISLVSVDPSSFSRVPGEQAKLTLTLRNQGRDPHQISLSVEGLPKDWVNSPALELPPGEKKTTIVISVPQDRTQALAGTYPLTVHAVSQTDPQEKAEAPVHMVVELDGEPRIEIIPPKREVQNGQSADFKVSIQNNSNATLQVSLRAQPADQLEFKLDRPEIKVAPAKTEEAALTVSLKEPVTKARTDRFTLELQRVFLLKDGSTKPVDDASVSAEVTWNPPVPTTLWHHVDLSNAPAAASDPAVYVWEADHSQHTVYRGTDNHIHELWYRAGSPEWKHYDFSPVTGPLAAAGDPAVYVWEGNRTQHIVYRDTDNHIHELVDAGSGWTHSDLSKATKAPAAAGDPAGYAWEKDGTQHIVYRGTDNHIHELMIHKVGDPGSEWGWSHFDLSDRTKAPAAAGDPAGYAWEGNGTQHIVYRGTDNHIHELWYRADSRWIHFDLSDITKAPAAAGDPAGYAWEGSRTQHVVYRGTDNHIHELVDAGSRWAHSDLSKGANVPAAAAAAGDPAGYASEADRSQHIVYRGTDNHIHELEYRTDHPGWTHSDLSDLTGAPAVAGDPAGYAWKGGDSQDIVYRDRDNHIHVLWRRAE